MIRYLLCMVALSALLWGYGRAKGEVYRAELVGKVRELSFRGPLKVGLGTADITPDWPVVLPYGRQEETENAYDRALAEALVLQVGELRVALVETDVIGIRLEDAAYIKRRIERETGLREDFIVLAATHGHSYPRTYRKKVRDFLAERCAEAVKRALEGTFEGRVGVGFRTLRKDLVVNRSNLYGPINTDLYVLRIDDREGNLRGILFDFGAHPTAFTVWGGPEPGWIGPEWPGYVRRSLEAKAKLEALYTRYAKKREVPDSLFVMFALGAAGDQQPNYEGIDRRDFVDVLSEEVWDLTSRIKTVPEVNLTFRWKVVELPLRKRPRRTLLQTLILDGTAAFSTVPGELVYELGRKLQRESGLRYVVPVTMANDYLGYLVSRREALEQVTYESEGSLHNPDLGERVLDEAIRLVNPGYVPGPWFDRAMMGGIEGRVDYRGPNRVVVGVFNAPIHQSYSGRWGHKMTLVDTSGHYVLKDLAPGTKFLFVKEVVSDFTGENRDRETIRTLLYAQPVQVEAGRVTRDVDFYIPADFGRTEVRALRLDSLDVEGHTVVGRVDVKGTVRDGETVTAGLYPAELPYWWRVLYVAHPLMRVDVDQEGEFTFEGVPPGRYRIGCFLDVNANGRPEYGIDIISGFSDVLTIGRP
ncbi:MAG TPA: hypothetical protein EYP17_01615 [Candidatus Latescibacteria bacterium]|nr:hypothetical protein [Candidatus Latescibacterota bacterium]